jgi:hypothetical protein
MSTQIMADSLLKLKLENGKTVEEELRSVHVISRLLDTQFSLFGVRFGLDSILGLIPVAGDVTTLVMGLVALFSSIRLKLPLSSHLTILWNLGFDTVLGSIPLIGDIFDFFFRSHAKNFKVVEKHLKRRAEKRAKQQGLSITR